MPGLIDSRPFQLPARKFLPPARVIRETHVEVNPFRPFRIFVKVPITLPHKLNPEMAPPPYCPPDSAWRHSFEAFQTLRPFIATALYEILGPHAPIQALLGPRDDPWETPVFESIWGGESWIGDEPDPISGRSRDGERDREPDSYDILHGRPHFYHTYEYGMQHLVTRRGTNPVIVNLRVDESLEDGVVFHASIRSDPEHTTQWNRNIDELWMRR